METLTAFLRTNWKTLAVVLALPIGLCACATEQPLLTKSDSLFAASGLPVPRKIKARTVIIQAPGSSADLTDNRKAGQRGGSAATAPGAGAAASQKKAPLPLWVFVLVGVGSIIGWEWVSHQATVRKWLPWRSLPA